MRKSLLLAASALMAPLAITAVPAAAEGVSYAAKAPVVELSVNETVQSAPDMATINVGVESKGATAQEALRNNSQQMDRLMAALDSYDIDDKDIQTSNLWVNEQWDYRNNERFSTGFVANNNLTVKVRDLDALGRILDGLTGAGATNISGPQFGLQDDTQVKSEARRRGIERMVGQARDYAEWAGYSNVRVIWVTENIIAGGDGPPRPPMPVMARAQSADMKEEAYIAPGEIGTSIQVSAKFEMVR